MYRNASKSLFRTASDCQGTCILVRDKTIRHCILLSATCDWTEIFQVRERFQKSESVPFRLRRIGSFLSAPIWAYSDKNISDSTRLGVIRCRKPDDRSNSRIYHDITLIGTDTILLQKYIVGNDSLQFDSRLVYSQSHF